MISIDRNIEPVLVLGAAGFVGGHLMDYLESQNIKFAVTKLKNEEIIRENCNIYDLDLLDLENVKKILLEQKPKSIINLAAQSSVGLSWKNMNLTVDINIKGTLNVLNSVREICPDTRVLMIGSSEEYGYIDGGVTKVSEDCNIRPGNPYAVTKASQTMFANMFYKAFEMDIMIMRAFNHVGPGQNLGFVVPDFAIQIAQIEKGLKEPIIEVGNLSAMRDFSDVRDIVRGYIGVLKNGKSGAIYNIGSGKAVPIQYLLDKLLSMAKCSIKVVNDPERMRPSDMKIVEADISRLQSDTGYIPMIDLDKTLNDTLNYFRKVV